VSGSSADEVAGILTDLVGRRPEIAPVADQVRAAFDLLRTAFAGGHKVLTCGNGGSGADAGHIVGELMKSMSRRRPLQGDENDAFAVVASAEQRDYLLAHLERALPVIDLGSHQTLLSAIGNDTAGDMGFAQQVIGYGRPGDVLWGLSTSGRRRPRPAVSPSSPSPAALHHPWPTSLMSACVSRPNPPHRYRNCIYPSITPCARCSRPFSSHPKPQPT
jgi:phosphoheptose isomerase